MRGKGRTENGKRKGERWKRKGGNGKVKGGNGKVRTENGKVKEQRVGEKKKKVTDYNNTAINHLFSLAYFAMFLCLHNELRCLFCRVEQHAVGKRGVA